MFPKMGFDKAYVGVLVLRPPGMPRTERQMQGPVCKSPEHQKYRVVLDARDKAQRLSSEPAKAPQLLTLTNSAKQSPTSITSAEREEPIQQKTDQPIIINFTGPETLNPRAHRP